MSLARDVAPHLDLTAFPGGESGVRAPSVLEPQPDLSGDLASDLSLYGTPVRVSSGEDSEDAAGARDGDPHPKLAYICTRIHAMKVAEHAATLRDEIDADPAQESLALWVPPAWAWQVSGIDLGRKDRAEGGGRLLMPVRTAYEQEYVVVLGPHEEQSIFWEANGLGLSATGSTQVRVSSYGWAEESTSGEGTWNMPEHVTVPLLSAAEALGVLGDLVDLGQQAKWELLAYMENYVRRSVATAHTSVSLEMREFWGRDLVLIDDTKIDQMVTSILLGDEAHDGYVLPLLDRCMSPNMFLRAEPIKYIRDSLRRDANQVVRRAIGDPHVGPKVRKVALELGTRDPDVVVDAYRARFPKDRLSVDRAKAALSVGPDAMARYFLLADQHNLA